MKKVLLSLLLVFSLLVPITNINGLDENVYSRITNEKTPVAKEQVTDVKSLNSGYGQDPVLYGEYLYTIKTGWGSTMPQLLQINKKSMEIEKSVDVIAQTGYTPFLAAGNGQIFVPLSDGRIQAFDASTMVSTWVSEKPKQAANVATRLTYHDGYLYYGVGGSVAKSGDAFMCVNTTDKNKENPTETNEIVWSYNGGQGYYWSEAVIVNNAIAFAGYDGKIVLHDLKSDTVYDNVDLTIGAITNSLFYDENTQKIVVANKNGFVATIDVVNNDLKENTIKKSQEFDGQFSSSPLCYNGRIYIAGGSNMGSKHAPFTVLEIATLKVIYTIDDIAGQCIPILSTAYSNEDNDHEIQLYMINFAFDSNKQTNLYHITDNQKNTTPIFQSLYAVSQPIGSSFWNGSLVMDEEAFYAYNGNGVIVRFGFDTSIQTDKDEQLVVNELNKEIAELPSKDNVSIKSDILLQTIYSKYSRLSDTYKKEVKNIELVKELETIIEEQNELINHLNEKITNELNIYYIAKEDEKLVDELINIYGKIHKVNHEFIENYQDVLDAKEIIDQLKKNIIPSQVFKNIDGVDIDYTVKSKMENDLTYSFTFNGMNLISTEAFNYTVSNESKYDSEIKKVATNAFILDFKFNGKRKTTFETAVSLTDGKYGLYHFNEETKKIEFIQDVVVEDGKTSMVLTKGAVYFISEKLDLDAINSDNNSKAVNTGDYSAVMGLTFTVFITATGIYLSRKKTITKL